MRASLTELKPEISAGSIAILLYLALVSSVAYTLWGILLRDNDVSKISVFGFTTVGQRTLNPSFEGSNPFRCIIKIENKEGNNNENTYDNSNFTANFIQQMLEYLSCSF